MEKINKPIRKEYLPVVLYVEDLEHIIDAFRVGGNKIEVRTDEYSFSSVSELSDHYGVQQPKYLIISSSNPFVELDLRKSETSYYIAGGSKDAYEIAYKLDKILSARQRIPSWAYSTYFVFSFFFLGVMLGYWVKGAILPGLVWYGWAAYINLYKHSKIVLEKRNNKRGFFKRNSDTIILLLIGAVAGAVATAVLTSPIQKLMEKFSTSEPSVSVENPSKKIEKTK